MYKRTFLTNQVAFTMRTLVWNIFILLCEKSRTSSIGHSRRVEGIRFAFMLEESIFLSTANFLLRIGYHIERQSYACRSLGEMWGWHVSFLSNVTPRYFTEGFQGILLLFDFNCVGFR